MTIAFPGRSLRGGTVAARNRLLEREIALPGRGKWRAVGRSAAHVAAGWARSRGLRVPGRREPAAYRRPSRLSELFAPEKDSLWSSSFMFPRIPATSVLGRPKARTAGLLPLEEAPCPSCALCRAPLLDQLDGAVAHATQHLSAISWSSRSPTAYTAGLRFSGAVGRGWRHLRLPLVGRQHVQPRLPRRVGRRLPAADAQRVPPRRRHDPPLLGRRAQPLRPATPARTTAAWNTFEPLWNLFDLTREGTARLGRAAELHLSAPVRWSCRRRS